MDTLEVKLAAPLRTTPTWDISILHEFINNRVHLRNTPSNNGV